MLTENLIVEKSKNYAKMFEDLSSLVEFITSDVQKHPSQVQQWFYNYSYFDLGSGLLGNCIFLAEMDFSFPNEGYAEIAHKILKAGINRENIDSIDNPSLWAGLTGVCYSIQALSKNHTRYVNLLEECDEILKPQIKSKIIQAKENLINNNVQMTDYDVIEGLSGIAVYLLESQKRDPEFKVLFDEIMDYFILLCDYKYIDNEKIPNWHISKSNQFLEAERLSYPNGNFNLGQSHGVSGILSILSLSVKIDIDNRKNINRAINILTDWLVESHLMKDNYVCWNKKMSLEHYLNKKNVHHDYLNFSWCYGDLTIARSIWLAGKALNDLDYQNFAINCFVSFKEQKNNHKLESPSYCHGIAGALHTIIEMKRDTGLLIFDDMEKYFLSQLLNSYSSEHTFGFQDVEIFQDSRYFFNKTGLLTGASGIYLVLLYYMKSNSVTNWQTLFLLK